MTDASIITETEQRRMAAVRRYDILDTPPDGVFDRITALAARRFAPLDRCFAMSPPACR